MRLYKRGLESVRKEKRCARLRDHFCFAITPVLTITIRIIAVSLNKNHACEKITLLNRSKTKRGFKLLGKNNDPQVRHSTVSMTHKFFVGKSLLLESWHMISPIAAENSGRARDRLPSRRTNANRRKNPVIKDHIVAGGRTTTAVAAENYHITLDRCVFVRGEASMSQNNQQKFVDCCRVE